MIWTPKKYGELSHKNMITSPFPHVKRSPSLWLHNKINGTSCSRNTTMTQNSSLDYTVTWISTIVRVKFQKKKVEFQWNFNIAYNVILRGQIKYDLLLSNLMYVRPSDITRWCDFTQLTSNCIRSHNLTKIT